MPLWCLPLFEYFSFLPNNAFVVSYFLVVFVFYVLASSNIQFFYYDLFMIKKISDKNRVELHYSKYKCMHVNFDGSSLIWACMHKMDFAYMYITRWFALLISINYLWNQKTVIESSDESYEESQLNVIQENQINHA